MSLRMILVIGLVLLWSAQSGAAIVKAPKQQSVAASSTRNSDPDPRRQKPKFVPVPAPTSHYATASRQSWKA